MKLICVPLTQAAMKRLDYNENIEGDLIELNLLQEDYEILENIGYFDNLNKQLGLMIDDYEDERILYESLPLALDITNNFSVKYKNNCKLWGDIKRLISIAIKNHTGVFFFF